MSPQNYTFMFYGFTVGVADHYRLCDLDRPAREEAAQELDRVKRMVEEGEQTKK